MARFPLASTALLAALTLLATGAHAGPGVGLRWSNCFLDGGLLNRNFACDTNSGTNILVGSFVLAAPMSDVSGNVAVVDFAMQNVSVPSWWLLRNAGACRPTSLTASFLPPATSVICQDWAESQALGGIMSYSLNVRGQATARVVLNSVMPYPLLGELVSGVEYFSFVLAINNAKTVGDGSCAGCSVPVCITLPGIQVTTPIAENDRVVSGAINGTDSYFATWQGGGVWPYGNGKCPNATAIRRQTWGAVKALYR